MTTTPTRPGRARPFRHQRYTGLLVVYLLLLVGVFFGTFWWGWHR